MSKDPAVLFYTSDFITGTLLMSNEQRGKYIILLCLQHQQGGLTKDDMLNICKTHDKKVFDKFDRLEDGLYYNYRMNVESNRRKAYSESRRKNRKTSKTYDKHMETETENVNKVKTKKSIPPIFKDVSDYCKERNKNVDPQKWFDFYTSKGWMIGKNKMKDWKAAIRTWEKDEIQSSATINYPELADLVSSQKAIWEDYECIQKKEGRKPAIFRKK